MKSNEIGVKRSRAIKIKSRFLFQVLFNMYSVYLIRSKINHEKTYIGFTADIEQRLQEHNLGKSLHTADFRPWQLVTYVSFDSKLKALEFEKYLKVGSGHAFARRHFW